MQLTCALHVNDTSAGSRTKGVRLMTWRSSLTPTTPLAPFVAKSCNAWRETRVTSSSSYSSTVTSSTQPTTERSCWWEVPTFVVVIGPVVIMVASCPWGPGFDSSFRLNFFSQGPTVLSRLASAHSEIINGPQRANEGMGWGPNSFHSPSRLLFKKGCLSVCWFAALLELQRAGIASCSFNWQLLDWQHLALASAVSVEIPSRDYLS